MKIKDFNPENRPMERMIEKGGDNLSDAELLAIILKTGTKNQNVLELANLVLSKFPMNSIDNLEINELTEINGIGKVKASQIKAVYELHKRLCGKQNLLKEELKVYAPSQVYAFLKEEIGNKFQENLVALFLRGNNIISKKIITIGTDNQTLISHKSIISYALKERAQALIIAHNHPSGEAYPSREDITETQKLSKISKELDICFLDHLIITRDAYFSFKEKGMM
ncbi:MAG: DNA repair protein RadC [archaeon]